MGSCKVACGLGFAAALLALQGAHAQVLLPEIDVTASRILRTGPTGSGGGSTIAPATAAGGAGTSTGVPASIGIVGASTTVITADEIARAPELSLPNIIGREAGAQTTSLYNGVNGTGATIDLRGFGVTSPSNVLVLVDGRRFNDSDLTGFDFSLIPRNSIERIEITRGNSGAVLYGDGAVGGVINIITKNGVGLAPNARIEGAFGSFATREAKASASGSQGPFSAALFGNAFSSDGYRQHNQTRQTQGVADFRYTVAEGSAFFNISADSLRQNLPGPRNIANGPFVGNFNEYATDPRGTNTPLDYGNRQNIAARGGVTRRLADGLDLILDGSVRHKDTQFASFNPANSTFLTPNAPSSYNTTGLAALSVTPRVNFDQVWGDVRARMVAGSDIYKTVYQSNRAAYLGASPNHVYDLDQVTAAVYAQPTFTFWNNTDFSFGGRIQRNAFRATDTFNPSSPIGPLGANPQGLPLDTHETDRAYHLGLEHRFGPNFAVFARMAQSFRLPNIDERVGEAPVLTVTNFDLKTQKSRDYEAGVRLHWNQVDVQSSLYDMYLVDELHFSPITFANTNLDPTRRYGSETTVTWRPRSDLRFKGVASYTRAVFRSGPFAGNDVPEVARWSGSAAVSWDAIPQYLTFDAVARMVGKRYADGDEANTGVVKVPAYTVVDVRLGGAIDRFLWSVSVQNLFNTNYYEYALDTSFPGNTFVSVYPLAGRSVLVRGGVTF